MSGDVRGCKNKKPEHFYPGLFIIYFSKVYFDFGKVINYL